MRMLLLVLLVGCGAGPGATAGTDSGVGTDSGEDAHATDSGPPPADSSVPPASDSGPPPADSGPADSSVPPGPCEVGVNCLGGRQCCGDRCVDLSLGNPDCGACGNDCRGDPTTWDCRSGSCGCGAGNPCAASTEECCEVEGGGRACVPRGTCGREPPDCGLGVACVDPLGVEWWCVDWGLCPRICGECGIGEQCCETVVDGERGQGCGPLGGPGECGG